MDVCRIAKILHAVKNSDRKLEEFLLDGNVIQADYYWTFIDTDMLRNASSMLNVSPSSVVDWLNNAKGDYGI